MSTSDISVIVPVGPDPAYKQFLPSCMKSILAQTRKPDQVVLVDDMAYMPSIVYYPEGMRLPFDNDLSPVFENIEMIYNAWLLGCAASWNIGVAEAEHEWCILMGSDDELLPGCLDACRKVLENDPDPLGYYNLTCQIDTGERVTAFNNAAMVSKSLWKYSGGFPITAALGAPDALLISIMMVHMPDHLHQIEEGTPYYWVRTHEAQDTRRQAGLFSWECIQVRDKETQRWTRPKWSDV